MKTFCPFCGIANASGATTCRACGTSLSGLTGTAAGGSQPGGSLDDGQMFENGSRYTAPGGGSYSLAPQPAWPQADATIPQAPPQYPQAYAGQRPWDPSGRQGRAAYGQAAPVPPNGGSVAPTGPYNGAYPAQYVPAPPLPPGYVYLPGDPRATVQVPSGYGYPPGDPRMSGQAFASPYVSVPYSTGQQPVPFGAMPVDVRSGKPELADCGARLGAFMLDSLALSVPWFIVMGLAAGTGSAALQFLSLMAMFFGPAFYFVACWAGGGQTLGYRALGLKLVRTDGSQPGVGSAIARCLGIMICLSMLVPGFLGLMWMLWDDRKQALHDKMSDTLVVKA